MREEYGGELLWMLNMAGRGWDGVLLSHLGRLDWGYGRILGGGVGCFLVIPDLSTEAA